MVVSLFLPVPSATAGPAASVSLMLCASDPRAALLPLHMFVVAGMVAGMVVTSWWLLACQFGSPHFVLTQGGGLAGILGGLCDLYTLVRLCILNSELFEERWCVL